MKARRQALLVDFIQEGRVTSQSEAVRLLGNAGVQVTQATVSRDLDDLAAVRVRDGKGVRYGFIEAPSYGASLGQVLRAYVIGKVASGSLAVLHTPPGHADVVAAALDRAHLAGVLGTVAGDDTLFICGDEATQGVGVISILEKVERNR